MEGKQERDIEGLEDVQVTGENFLPNSLVGAVMLTTITMARCSTSLAEMKEEKEGRERRNCQ